jgi:hypothetical protein
VQKTIIAFMVNESKRIAQSKFVKLVVEDPMVKANRENFKKVIEALKIAQGLLNLSIKILRYNI